MSDRIVVNFTPGGKEVTHGGAGTAYANYGCRCDPCTAANSNRGNSARGARSPDQIDDPAKHGKPGTYTNWNCRCEPCSEAHTRACQDQYQARKAAAKEGVAL